MILSLTRINNWNLLKIINFDKSHKIINKWYQSKLVTFNYRKNVKSQKEIA